MKRTHRSPASLTATLALFLVPAAFVLTGCPEEKKPENGGTGATSLSASTPGTPTAIPSASTAMTVAAPTTASSIPDAAAAADAGQTGAATDAGAKAGTKK